VIGRLWVDDLTLDGSELSRFLIDGAFVRPYSGGRRGEWSADTLRSIIESARDYLGESDG